MIFRYRPIIREKTSLIRKLSFHRLINIIKIWIGYKWSVRFNKVTVWGYPFAIQLETSAVCNLKCPECIAGIGATNRTRNFPDPGMFYSVLDDFRKYSFYCNLYFQGEPFLNPELFSLIRHAKQLNYYTVISSNGHFLSEANCINIIESNLDRIIISLDGMDAESYNQYRINGQFDKVVNGIKMLTECRKKMAKSHPLVEIQFLVNKTNEHQLKDAENFIKGLGADILQFKSMQIYSEKGIGVFLPENNKYNRYGEKIRKVRMGCFRLWSSIVITSDGYTVPCCYDKKPDYILGHFQKQQIKEMWLSDKYYRFRKIALQNIKEPAICTNCIQ